jgi:SSS family solute:Na+ symporter
MVSGLFVPTLGAYFWKRRSSIGAFWGMLSGGLLTLLLIILNAELPFGLDATLFGILLSAVVFISVSLLFPDQKGQNHDG